MNKPSADNQIKLVIADDHPIFRRGLRAVIEAEPGWKVVAEAEDGDAALSQICEHLPDIAVLDLDMPKRDGFELTRALREKYPALAIIFLTLHNSESIFNASLDLGVKGYVLKDSAMPEIIDCIKAVSGGRHYISPQLSSFLVNRGNQAAAVLQDNPGLKDLTPAQRRILHLIAEDKTSRQIADELFISIRTVDRHRADICLKLELRGTNALVKFAIANKSRLK